MEHTSVLTVEVTLLASDLYDPFEWNRANISRWLTAILGVVVAYLILFSPQKMFHGEYYVSLLWVTVAALFCIGIVFYPSMQVNEQFRAWPKMALPVTVDFGAERIRFESEDGLSELKWSAFPRVVETRRAFQFLGSGGQAFHVPKRCLSSPQDVELLRQIIREHSKERLELRSD